MILVRTHSCSHVIKSRKKRIEMRAFVLLAFIPAVFCASLSERAPNCGQFCIELYDPVCGTNGKTYSNSCFLGIASCNDNSVSLAHKGPCNRRRELDPCSMTMCPAIYSPVCGTDHKTYGNKCVLQTMNCKSGVSVAHDGPCDDDLVVS